MSKLTALLAVGMLVSASGCANRIVDFTVISTKNIDWSKASTFTRAKSRSEGKDAAHIIIFIPTGVPNMKEAVDRAIESVPGAVALLDGVVAVKFYYIPFIYGRQWFVVEGTPLIYPGLAQTEAVPPDTGYLVVHFDKKGNVAKREHVSKDEYEAIRDRAIPGKS